MPRGKPWRHALLAGSDPTTCQLCTDVLEALGYSVTAVESGVAAVTAALQHQPQLIILDMQLRDVSGLEAMAWLRAQLALQATPAIMLSASAKDARPGLGRATTLLEMPLSRFAVERAVRDAGG